MRDELGRITLACSEAGVMAGALLSVVKVLVPIVCGAHEWLRVWFNALTNAMRGS